MQQSQRQVVRAVVDIGTVTTRFMAARCTLDDTGACVDVLPLRKRSTITQLGEGLVQTGVLSQQALQRVAQAIDDFVLEMRQLGVQMDDAGSRNVVGIATSAARDARNSDELVQLLKQRGIELTVIPGEREAMLSFAGATHDFAGPGVLVSDIGGGSTELIVGSCERGQQAQITRSHSFNVGCRRVTDMFLESDPPTPQQLAQADSWVEQQLQPFFEGSLQVTRHVAVAGTATSLSSVCQGLVQYDSSKVHGHQVELEQVQYQLQRLAAMTLEQRQHVVGLQPQRAGVFVTGLLILSRVMQLCGLQQVTVSEQDNLLGLLLDFPV